jgi:hypothetical protein
LHPRLFYKPWFVCGVQFAPRTGTQTMVWRSGARRSARRAIGRATQFTAAPRAHRSKPASTLLVCPGTTARTSGGLRAARIPPTTTNHGHACFTNHGLFSGCNLHPVYKPWFVTRGANCSPFTKHGLAQQENGCAAFPSWQPASTLLVCQCHGTLSDAEAERWPNSPRSPQESNGVTTWEGLWNG